MPTPESRAFRVERGLYYSSLAVLVLVALLLRWRALDPPSLWLDDQWIAIVATQMDWGQFFELRPPVPAGFVAVLRFCASLFDDPEWPLQLFPFLCGLIVIPLGSLLVTRWTGRCSLGALAAALLAVCPEVSAYSVATKQYASDCLISVALLLLGLPLLTRWTSGRALAMGAVSLGVIPLSFTSIFVSFPLVNLAALSSALRGSGDGQGSESGPSAWWRPVGVALAYNLGFALMYGLLLHGRASAEMSAYWQAYFLPLGSGEEIVRFLSSRYWSFLGGVLPHRHARVEVLLVFPALVFLFADRRTRFVGLFFLLFNVQMLIASGLKLYPLGAGRTDIFSFPVTLLLLALGLHHLTGARRLRRATAVAFIILAVGAMAGAARPQAYGHPGSYIERPCEDAALVRALNENIGEEDALLVYPHGSFAVGYYGRWSVETRPWEQYAHGFEVRVLRPGSLVLPGYSDLSQWRGLLAPDLSRFLTTVPGPRLFFFASFTVAFAHAWIDDAIQRHGFQPIRGIRGPRAALIIYQRQGDPESEGR